MLNDTADPKRSRSGGGNGGSKAALFAKHGKLRSDGRPHDTGLVRPYRPCPPDFRARFLEMGWDGIDEHYHTNWRVIRRWIEECGGEELRAARRRISGGSPRPGLRSEFRAKEVARSRASRKRKRKG